jgi:hypothetical protein
LSLHDYDFHNIDWTLDFPVTSTTTTHTSANDSNAAAGNDANDELLSTQQPLTQPDATADQYQDLLAHDWSQQQNAEHASTLFELPSAPLDFLGSYLADSLSNTHGIDMADHMMSTTTSSLGTDLNPYSSQASTTSLAGLASVPLETVSPASSHSNSSTHRVETGRVEKRQRNTEAARRYRQRKLDKLSTVEEALLAMTKERDELRLELARAKAEADILKGMVSQRS